MSEDQEPRPVRPRPVTGADLGSLVELGYAEAPPEPSPEPPPPVMNPFLEPAYNPPPDDAA